MQPTGNICRTCGKSLDPGQTCQECTAVDINLNKAFPGSRAQAGSADVQSSIEAFLIDGDDRQRIQVPASKCKIGRDPTNQVVIVDDPFTSRFHAWITFENGRFFVEDLGSTNGTLLNGSPLVNRRPLLNGDLLAIGAKVYTFSCNGSRLPGDKHDPAGLTNP